MTEGDFREICQKLWRDLVNSSYNTSYYIVPTSTRNQPIDDSIAIQNAHVNEKDDVTYNKRMQVKKNSMG